MNEPLRPSGGGSGRLSWWRLLAGAVWLGLAVFCLQFALASAAELEPQAAVVGWMLVAIVFGAGVSVLAAARLDRPRGED